MNEKKKFDWLGLFFATWLYVVLILILLFTWR